MKRATFLPQELASDNILTPLTSLDEIVGLGSENIAQLIRYFRKSERRIRAALKDPQFATDGSESEMLTILRQKIAILLRLKRKATSKPIFPNLRPADHFNHGDEVACFVGIWSSEMDRKVINADWVLGSVVGGPSFIGTLYEVRAHERVHDGRYLDGHGLSYSVLDPRILRRADLNYLLQDHDFRSLWLANCHEHTKPSLRMIASMSHPGKEFDMMKH